MAVQLAAGRGPLSFLLFPSQSIMAATIQHHAQDQEFTIEQDSYTAELAYSQPATGVIDFTHTYVDEALRGKGLAEALGRAGLEYARAEQLKVRTSCEFMRGFVQRNAQYQDLLETPAQNS